MNKNLRWEDPKLSANEIIRKQIEANAELTGVEEMDEGGLTWFDAFLDVKFERVGRSLNLNYKAKRGKRWCTGEFPLPKVMEREDD